MESFNDRTFNKSCNGGDGACGVRPGENIEPIIYRCRAFSICRAIVNRVASTSSTLPASSGSSQYMYSPI